MAQKSEQRRCYEAEAEALARAKTVRVHTSEIGRQLLPGDMGTYLVHVVNTPWFKAQFQNQRLPIDVRSGKGTRASKASKSQRRITICRGHRESVAECEWTMLHELAHIVTGGSGHSHSWRYHYVLLVRRMLGYQAARYLREAFIGHDLPYRDLSIHRRVT